MQADSKPKPKKGLIGRLNLGQFMSPKEIDKELDKFNSHPHKLTNQEKLEKLLYEELDKEVIDDQTLNRIYKIVEILKYLRR